MQGAAMYDRMMTDGYIIADRGPELLVGTMNAGAVLHIHFVAQLYKVHIAADNRIEPETAIVAGYHIANNSSIGSNETVVAELRVFIFNGKYYRHKIIFWLPAMVFHGIVCCVTHFIVLFAAQLFISRGGRNELAAQHLLLLCVRCGK
jgi:hypothetical protein